MKIWNQMKIIEHVQWDNGNDKNNENNDLKVEYFCF